MVNASPEVASATILDLQGQPHALAELWSQRPAVLVFLRHFG
jgi:hypothetical protein